MLYFFPRICGFERFILSFFYASSTSFFNSAMSIALSSGRRMQKRRKLSSRKAKLEASRMSIFFTMSFSKSSAAVILSVSSFSRMKLAEEGYALIFFHVENSASAFFRSSEMSFFVVSWNSLSVKRRSPAKAAREFTLQGS